MKILILDTLYPQFIESAPIGEESYDCELSRIMARCFGTFDAYSRALRAEGWDAIDIIVNHRALQNRWKRDYGVVGNVLEAQIAHYRPDVIFLQDLSISVPRGTSALIAGQCSCPMPHQSDVVKCDVIFTSFPHYVKRFQDLGVVSIYVPLAFDPVVLERAVCPRERIYDVTFVGGVGAPSHWTRGMVTLEAIAGAIPSFRWWGYGCDTLPSNSALREKYRGPAWGLDMYKILLQSKIVVNRHGEVAEGFANNLRMYEATGCGALLITDNRTDLFGHDELVTYTHPAEAVDYIRWYLAAEDERSGLAEQNQARTMHEHTYAHRMPIISDALKQRLCGRTTWPEMYSTVSM